MFVKLEGLDGPWDIEKAYVPGFSARVASPGVRSLRRELVVAEDEKSASGRIRVGQNEPWSLEISTRWPDRLAVVQSCNCWNRKVEV